MNFKPEDNRLSVAFRIGELLFVLIALVYFLGYPRNTISDFIVLTALCLLLIFIGTNIGLIKPTVAKYSNADLYLVVFSTVLFITAWIIGFSKELLNIDSAIKAIVISIVYLYYAWIQHFLAQRYLALRSLKYFKQKTKDNNLKTDKLKAAFMTGFIFGILHIPYPKLILPAMLGGFVYVYYFLNTGRLWAVVISHALVASAGIFWLLEENPFKEFLF